MVVHSARNPSQHTKPFSHVREAFLDVPIRVQCGGRRPCLQASCGRRSDIRRNYFDLFWDFEEHGAIGADLLGVFGRLVIVKHGDDALVTLELESDVGLESSKKKRSKHRIFETLVMDDVDLLPT